MTYKNILQKGAFVALMTGTLVMTVSCNDDDVSPVLEERVLVKEINLEVTQSFRPDRLLVILPLRPSM